MYLNAEPSQLQPGLLSDGTNLRCRTGRPVTRRGVWKPAWLNKLSGERVIPWSTINGQPQPFSDPNGVEWIMLAADGGVFALRTYNTPLGVPLPAGVRIITEVSFVQAFNLMFMLRGELMAPLVMETVDNGFHDMVDRWDATAAYAGGDTVAWGPWIDGQVGSNGNLFSVLTEKPHGLITGSDIQVRKTSGGKQDGRYTVTVLDDYTFTFQAGDVTSVIPTLQWSTNQYYWTTAASVPLTFVSADIINMPSLVAKLKADPPAREVDKWLKGTLPSDTLAALTAYDQSTATDAALRPLLIRDFNALIHGPSIYDEARFKDVSLRSETKAFIGKDPAGNDLIRFNRMLLEDAYPSEFKHSVENDVPADEEPGVSSRWRREYLILPNCTNGVFVNNRLLVTTSWIPDGQFQAGSYGAKRDFVAASYVLDYTRYSPKNEFRINQGSADELQCLLKIGDSSVLTLKSQSVGLLTNLTGDTLDLLTLEMIIRNYGVANPRAATEVGRDAVFVSPRRGVVSLRQTEQNKIQGTEIAFSDPIRQWIDQIDWTLSSKIRVAYWNDALYVAAPVETSESYSLNWLEGVSYADVVDFKDQPFVRAGMTFRWDPAPDGSESFLCNGKVFTDSVQVEWDGTSVLGVQRHAAPSS